MEERPYHDWKMHVNLVADSIHRRLSDEIIPEMIDNVMQFVLRCREVYADKLKARKQDLDREYQNLREDLESSERLSAAIAAMEQRIAAAEEQLRKIQGLKGELVNYVGKQGQTEAGAVCREADAESFR